MDFGTLLHVAKKNNQPPQQPRCYSTKFSPPKKETKDRKLSAGIQKFLAKKEMEDREKERALRENREKLEAMRDNKSKNRIGKMLKVIKSANKSVLQEEEGSGGATGNAKSGNPLQPDEDDYGYVSQESSALYKRLMEKYTTADDESSAAAAAMDTKTHRRPESVAVRKSTPAKSNKGSSSSSTPATLPAARSDKRAAVNSKGAPAAAAAAPMKPPRRTAPPPPVADFHTLLKLAEQKQFEPIKVEAEQSKKEERPMTSKEKREHEERMRLAEARRKRLESDSYDYRKADALSAGPASKSASGPMAKLGRKPDPRGLAPVPKLPGAATTSNPPSQGQRIRPSMTPSPAAASSRPQKLPDRDSGRPAAAKVASQPQAAAAPVKTRQFPPPDVQKTRSFPPDDVQRRPAASSRAFPPADVRRRPEGGPGGRDYKRPRIEDDFDAEEDDDEDYDSEMDDFIDDGPLDQQDVSACIKEIFGYDKNRYRDEDYDDREMESSFAQQMREEQYSRKIGRLEDEADMRQEALDKARKAARKRAANRDY